MGEDYKSASLTQTKITMSVQKHLDNFLKFRIYSEQILSRKKNRWFLGWGPQHCILGPSWNCRSLSWRFFFLLLLKNWFLNISAQTAEMEFLLFHFSVFLNLELYQLLPCTYITVMHQRTQNNSQKIGAHFVWAH